MIADQLQILLRSGTRRMGELSFQTGVSGCGFILYHHLDTALAEAPGFGGLARHVGPSAARELATFTAGGEYRCAKARADLRRGWVLVLADSEELRQALDQFYPAAVGLLLALRDGTLEIQHLRAKLGRQSGMLRVARNISDAGAQRLVREVCGPAHHCAKRILWQIDADTPLEDSAASRYHGIPGGVAEGAAIPLLCREACNHFVDECRRAAANGMVQRAKRSTP